MNPDDDKRTHSVPLDTGNGEEVIEQQNVGAGVERGGGEFPDPHTPPQPPAPGSAATGASTLTEVTGQLESDGFHGQFVPELDAVLRCLACGYRAKADTVALDRLCRLEGASDPADMAAVAALTCPRCHTKGTAVLKYGPDSDPESAGVLAALERSAP